MNLVRYSPGGGVRSCVKLPVSFALIQTSHPFNERPPRNVTLGLLPFDVVDFAVGFQQDRRGCCPVCAVY